MTRNRTCLWHVQLRRALKCDSRIKFRRRLTRRRERDANGLCIGARLGHDGKRDEPRHERHRLKSENDLDGVACLHLLILDLFRDASAFKINEFLSHFGRGSTSATFVGVANFSRRAEICASHSSQVGASKPSSPTATPSKSAPRIASGGGSFVSKACCVRARAPEQCAHVSG